MKIRMSAGAAALHACSTLTECPVLTSQGALLAFEVEDLDLDDTLGALKSADDTIGEAIIATDNEALIAGLTDLRRSLQDIEREVRQQFQQRDVIAALNSIGSHPTATTDAAISIAPTQNSVTQNEEHENEPQPEPQQQRRRRQ